MDRFYTQPIQKLSPKDFHNLLELALEEDCPDKDITSEAIFSDEKGIATLNSRESGVLCGIDVLSAISERFSDFTFQNFKMDGDRLEPGSKIADLSGRVRTLLRVERIVLNFLQYLSGIASQTQVLVNRYPNLMILDTRKTLPGYRKLVKYAVYTGGGSNHRIHLSDMAMIKDNHIALSGGIASAIRSIRQQFPGKKVELEIDRLEDLEVAISEKPDILLLDNFSEEQTRTAIEKIRAQDSSIRIECSGGITPEELAFLSQWNGIGVSMGYLTHTTRFMDLGLDIEVKK